MLPGSYEETAFVERRYEIALSHPSGHIEERRYLGTLSPPILSILEHHASGSAVHFFARDVIYTSRAYAMIPVRLSVCLGRKCIGAL